MLLEKSTNRDEHLLLHACHKSFWKLRLEIQIWKINHALLNNNCAFTMLVTSEVRLPKSNYINIPQHN
jgi:hypothetical protein